MKNSILYISTALLFAAIALPQGANAQETDAPALPALPELEAAPESESDASMLDLEVAPIVEDAEEAKEPESTPDTTEPEVAPIVESTEEVVEEVIEEVIEPKSRRGMMGLGLFGGAKLGAGFGQLTSGLGSTVIAEFEAGYVLPLPAPLHDDLSVIFTGQYIMPGTSETVSTSDGRLADDGSFSYELTLYQFVGSLGLVYHIPRKVMPWMMPWVDPYVMMAGRIHATRTKIEGEADGADYGQNDETDTRFGIVGAIGAEVTLIGPGALTAELQMGWVGMDGFVLKETNASAINLAVGYRVYF